MASHLKYPLFFVLSYAAASVADSTQAKLFHDNNTSSSLSSYLQPRDFPNEELYNAYLVIQRFKSTITCDPSSITRTWTGHDICGKTSYLGFYCTTPSEHSNNLTVTVIDFHGFGLCAPKLQGFIDQLPDLAIFLATSNKLIGDIPRLDTLPYMYNLVVGSNHSDQIYEPLDKHCVYLSVDSLLKGQVKLFCTSGYAIQKEVSGAGWTKGKVLILNNNRLAGALPADLGFSAVSYLALANNKLTGPIPPSVGQLQDSLLEVLLFNNQLSGCLPHEVGMLTKAVVIDVGMNQLTGPIPSSFSCLSNVEQLNLAGNRLYGEVPDALCKLAGPTGRLVNLTLTGNYFTSVGPACAALIKDGALDVKNNCIPGVANQRRPVECVAFQSQPKTCPAASAQVTCPTAAAKAAAAPGDRKVRDYYSYVTYATLHE